MSVVYELYVFGPEGLPGLMPDRKAAKLLIKQRLAAPDPRLAALLQRIRQEPPGMTVNVVGGFNEDEVHWDEGPPSRVQGAGADCALWTLILPVDEHNDTESLDDVVDQLLDWAQALGLRVYAPHLQSSMWVIDRFCVPDWGVGNAEGNVLELAAAMETLRGLVADQGRPSVRLKRLVELLARFHPGATGAHQAEASVWQGGVAPRPAEVKLPLWRVPDNPDDRARLLPALVQWAFELGLDVYDEDHGVYLPTGQEPMPQGRGTAYQNTFWPRSERMHWAAAHGLRKEVADGLTRVLDPAGFVLAMGPDDTTTVRLQRNVADGLQRVQAEILGPGPLWRLRVSCEHHSQAVARGWSMFAGGAGKPLMQPVVEHLHNLRANFCPDWADENMGLWALDHCSSRAWLDWLMEDVLALMLPLLDAMSTADGLLRALGSAEHELVVPNLHGSNAPEQVAVSLMQMCAVLLAQGKLSECKALLREHQGLVDQARDLRFDQAEGLLRLVAHLQGTGA